MNPPAISTPAVPPRQWPWIVLGATLTIGCLLVPIMLVTGVIQCITLNHEAATLRNGLMKSATTQWDKNIEVGVGSILLGAVRTGLGFVDLPPEDRAALKTVRGASVGVYERHGGGAQTDSATLLSDADKAMTSGHWDRLVTVLSKQDLVAIYVPHNITSPKDVKVCLVTVNGCQMVIVSARSNLEPLLALAMQQPDMQSFLSGLSNTSHRDPAAPARFNWRKASAPAPTNL